MGANVTKNNKFVNERMDLLRAWGKDYITSKVESARKKVSELTEPRLPDGVIEALVMDNILS